MAALIPITAYLVIGMRKGSRSRSVADYFVYSQRVSGEDYATTSVGYALQMAAVFLFTFWGAKFGLGALWTPLFWAIGIGLLITLLPTFRRYHAEVSEVDADRVATMHEYMAQAFQGGLQLRRLTAAATIIGLWGTMMAEVDYTVQVFLPIAPSARAQIFISAFFLIFGLVYILHNGYKAEVNTERFQVPIAYAAFIALILLVLPSVWLHSGAHVFVGIAVILAATLGLLLVGKLMMGVASALRDPQLLIPAAALIGLGFDCWFVRHLQAGTGGSVFRQPLTTQLSAQGMLGIVSLLVANALWQPVDLSTWQRIASVQGKGSKLDQILRRGTWRFFFESPATWILGAILGWIISAGGFLKSSDDPSNALTAFVSSIARGDVGRGSYSILPYVLLVVTSITIMLSTVHCLVSAVSFTFYKDIVQSRATGSLRSAKVWTSVLVVSGMFLYPLLRWHFGANLYTLLYAAYSAQLSLIVVAIASLLRRRLQARAAVASIIAGFTGTIFATYLALRIPNDNTAVLSPIFAVCASLVAFILFSKRPAPQTNADAGEATR